MASKRQRSKGTGTLYKRESRGPWIAAWYDHNGRRREASTRTTDRAAAERILAKRVADTALRRDGVIDARSDQYAEHERRPIADHLADWCDSLAARGTTAKHASISRKRVEHLLAAIGATRISDLSASAVQQAAGDLRKAGLSTQTAHHYLRAIKGFSRWLRRDGRARDDALAHLSGFNFAADRRYTRRALEPDELRRLVLTAEHSPKRKSLSGADRATLYLTAAGTGFRASELASLTPASFNLSGDAPAVTLSAARSKRRRADVQPIRADLAGRLATWLKGKPADAPVWPGRWPEKAAAMMRADLRSAKARWIRETQNRVERRKRRDSDSLAETDSAGRVADFHAIRVSFVTTLIRGGANAKAVQELARHSTPMLTLAAYTRLGIHDLTAALDVLPDVVKAEPAAAVATLAATGTDDRTAKNAPADPQQFPQQLPRFGAQTSASRRVEASGGARDSQALNPVATVDIRESAHTCATQQRNAPGGTRTPDLRIRRARRDSRGPAKNAGPGPRSGAAASARAHGRAARP